MLLVGLALAAGMAAAAPAGAPASKAAPPVDGRAAVQKLEQALSRTIRSSTSLASTGTP